MPDKYFTQIKDELIRSKKLTPNEKAVLNVLLSYGDCDEIFLGQKRLASEANMHRKTVISTVKSLAKKRYIKTSTKVDRSSLVYKLNPEMVVTLSNNVVTKSDKGCNSKLQGVVTKSDTSNKRLSNKSRDITELPDWLDKKAWSEFEQHRKDIKKKLTALAATKAINFLSDYKDQQAIIIDQTIVGGWTTLYPPKGGYTNQDPPRVIGAEI